MFVAVKKISFIQLQTYYFSTTISIEFTLTNYTFMAIKNIF